MLIDLIPNILLYGTSQNHLLNDLTKHLSSGNIDVGEGLQWFATSWLLLDVLTYH